jgi:ribosomal protein L9
VRIRLDTLWAAVWGLKKLGMQARNQALEEIDERKRSDHEARARVLEEQANEIRSAMDDTFKHIEITDKDR